MTEHDQQHGHVQGRFIDEKDVPHHPGDPTVNVPTVHTEDVMMLDDDNGNCAPATPWGHAPWYLPYADNYVDNVASFSFRLSDPWGFAGAENDPITFTLVSGAQVVIPRDWIAKAAGGAATALRKIQNVVYPADSGYNMLLDETNTPNLVAVDNFILSLTKAAAAERYEIAEIVAAFADDIAQLGHEASHESYEMKEQLAKFGKPRGE